MRVLFGLQKHLFLKKEMNYEGNYGYTGQKKWVDWNQCLRSDVLGSAFLYTCYREKM